MEDQRDSENHPPEPVWPLGAQGGKCFWVLPAETKEWRRAIREGLGQGRAEMVPTKRWNPQGVELVWEE